MTNVNVFFQTAEHAEMVGRALVDTLPCWIRQGRLEVIRKDGRVWIMRGILEGLLVVVCPVCGARFRRSNLRSRYCSTLCRQRVFRRKEGRKA